jgi:hypothetical protein
VYLVDQFNKAKMLRKENGEWVDTSLEEKYGHLVNQNENITAKGVVEYRKGYGIPPRNGVDYGYQFADLGCRMTGNTKVVRKYDEELGKEVYEVYSQMVFRDGEKALQELEVRCHVFDAELGVYVYVATNGCGDDKCSPQAAFGTSNDTGLNLESVEEYEDYFQHPKGRAKILIPYEMPNYRPQVYTAEIDGSYYSDIGTTANYFSWKRDQNKLRDLARQLFAGGRVEVPEGLVIPAQEARIYMTGDEFYQERLEYVQSLGYKTIEEWRQAKKEADGQ